MIPPAWSPMTLRALRGGAGAVIGRPVERLEALSAELANRFGTDEVLLTDSGTSALALALGGPGAPKPVAMPCYGCFDLATAANQAGAEVFLYDLDPSSLQPDLPSLERALAAGARRVLVVHLFGLPVDLGPVEEVCRPFDAFVVEDAAQAFAARLRSRPAGSLAEISILSFNRGKGVSGGGGGALLGFGRGAARLRRLRKDLHATPRTVKPLFVAAAQWLFGRPRLYSLPRSLPFLQLGETVYRLPRPPAWMSAVSAALLLHTVVLADREAEVRRRNAERLRSMLAGLPDIMTVEPLPGSEPSYLRLPALLRNRARQAATREGRRYGIAAGYPLLLRDLAPLAPRIKNAEHGFPGGTRLVAELHTFPTHGWLKDTDVEAIRDLVARGGV